MKKRIPFALVAFFAVGLGLALPNACSGEEAGQPFVRLYDTGTPSPEPLSAAAVAAKAGWVQIRTDDKEHKFKGDLALGNDRLTVVIPAKGGSAFVYTPAGGEKRRTPLVPILKAGGAAEQGAAFRILENTSGAVAVEVTFANPATATFRLVVGQPYVEVRPGAGMAALRVDVRPRVIVVPDFFGDDMIFWTIIRPAFFWQGPFSLPAENFVLALCGSDDSITMCVWQDRRIVVRTEAWKKGDAPLFMGLQIDCFEGKSIWVAFLEGEGLWRVDKVPGTDTGKALDWKLPFPAKWRADSIGDGYPFAESVTFESPLVLKPDLYVIYPIDRTKATPLTEFTPVDILRNTLGVGPCQYILETEGLASADNPTPDNVLTWVEKQVKKKGGKDAADDIRERLKAMVELAGRTEARIKRYADFAAEMKQSFAADSSAIEIKATIDTIAQAAADGLAVTQPPGRVAKLADAVGGLIGKDTAAADLAAPAAELRAIGAAQDRALAKSRMAVRWLGCQSRTSELAKRTDAFLQGK